METAKAPPSLLGAPAGGLELVGQGQGLWAQQRADLPGQGQRWPKARGMWALSTPHSPWLYRAQETLASAQVVGICLINLACLGCTGCKSAVLSSSAPQAL